ncbi:bestrophin-like domain [Pontibacter sp. CAU 1760]
MYDLSSGIIVTVLFILILLAKELGNFFGERYKRQGGEDIKTQTTTVLGGVFGLLALLLGFSFSMAVHRFDNRTEALIAESNAIGTALLRSSLLPDSHQKTARMLLQQYVDVRLEMIDVDLTQRDARRDLNQRTEHLQDALWAVASSAVEVDPRPVTTGLFVTALNNMIDAQGRRNAVQQRYVPEVIFVLLFLVFIAAGALMGYAKGLSKNRSRVPTTVFVFLIVLVVFIIIDLDRPMRSTIKVNQEIMLDLKDE